MTSVNSVPPFGRGCNFAGSSVGFGFPSMEHTGIREALDLAEKITGQKIRAPWEDTWAPSWGEPTTEKKSFLGKITSALFAPVKFLWQHKGLALLGGAALLAYMLYKK
jgi:hypothetical protein